MNDSRGKKLRRLIDRAGITQREAAGIINRETGEAITPRTLRRWLADPALPSARRCPAWGLAALERGLAKKLRFFSAVARYRRGPLSSGSSGSRRA